MKGRFIQQQAAVSAVTSEKGPSWELLVGREAVDGPQTGRCHSGGPAAGLRRMGVKLDQMSFHANGRGGNHTGRLQGSCQRTSMQTSTATLRNSPP